MGKQVSVVFLDVGQGDGTLIISPEAELVLIDLGSKKNAEIAGTDALIHLIAVIRTAMAYRHSDQPLLNKLLITHGDGDHYNLIIRFLKYVKTETGKDLQIDEIAIGGPKSDYEKEFRETVLDPADKANRLTVFDDSYHDKMKTDGTVVPTWTLASGAVKLYLLSANYPKRDGGAKNPKSLVVMLEYATRYQKLILTGDAEELTEEAILDYYKRDLSFLVSFGLKLGHHGSKAGTSENWLKAVKQIASFASSDMKWAHPYCETIARIAETIGPGAKLYKHRWICGRGAGESKEYQNWDDEYGFYTTMAYMTEKPMQDPEDKKWYSPGLVQGVQYNLIMYDNGYMQMIDTLKGDSGVFDPKRGATGVDPEALASLSTMEGFIPPMPAPRNRVARAEEADASGEPGR